MYLYLKPLAFVVVFSTNFKIIIEYSYFKFSQNVSLIFLIILLFMAFCSFILLKHTLFLWCQKVWMLSLLLMQLFMIMNLYYNWLVNSFITIMSTKFSNFYSDFKRPSINIFLFMLLCFFIIELIMYTDLIKSMSHVSSNNGNKMRR